MCSYLCSQMGLCMMSLIVWLLDHVPSQGVSLCLIPCSLRWVFESKGSLSRGSMWRGVSVKKVSRKGEILRIFVNEWISMKRGEVPIVSRSLWNGDLLECFLVMNIASKSHYMNQPFCKNRTFTKKKYDSTSHQKQMWIKRLYFSFVYIILL